jgi:Na+-transporting methylmalonyl-CoA/oxaloacetate decarboxylase gamma subunit
MMIFATVVLAFLILMALLLFFASYVARKLQEQRRADREAGQQPLAGDRKR